MAYNGAGHRIGVCRTTSKAPPRIPLYGPRGQTDPAAEEEGGDDDRAKRAHEDQSGGGGNM